ncbi:MAG TPA: efflux RND transporter periplasmic adaptor subunit, partial [Planctomycetota bacterium]|nr:efflux RND transporter periplasmic adaptor subunit [Planctomycetota bacterium]
ARVALSRAQASLAEISNQLAEFERTGSARQTADLQNARQRAISEVALLEAQLARLEPLLADGLVAEKAVAEARQALELARTDREASDAALAAFESSGRTLQHSTLTAARDAAELEAREAERGLAEIEVRAPSDGRLAEWSVRSGEWLAPGAALGRWISAAGRELSLQVPASRWSELALGQRVTWLDARGETRSATLVRIDGAVATQSGTVEAIAKPEAGEDALLPGLQLFAEIELARLTDVLLVPERAVLRADDARVIVVVREQRAARVPVKWLGSHAGLAAIEGDVRAGEHVVVDGGYNLPDGAGIALRGER